LRIQNIKIVLFVFTLILVFTSRTTYGQGFKGSLLVGFNASQIDGDSLYGFNKLGWHIGGRISYPYKNNMDFSIEMLFSQRGSDLKLFAPAGPRRYSLNYFEIPFLYTIKDWYVEDKKFHRVRLDGGFSYGYLFDARSELIDPVRYKSHDLSWVLGAGFHFTRRLSTSIRYTSSLFDMLDPIDPKIPSIFRGYFLTFRTEVNF
jgi:hypothetical protein